MWAGTSPGSSRKSPPSRALTPGKLIEMSRISTTGAGVPSGTDVVVIGPPDAAAAGVLKATVTRGVTVAFTARGRPLERSVLALGERRLGRGLVEDRLLGQHPGRDRLTGLDLLGQVHQLLA